MNSREAFIVLAAALLGAAGCTGIPDAQPATPQRPTFSFSAATTAAGTVELETGVLDDPGTLVDTPTTLKFGWDERTEVSVRASPLIHVQDGAAGDHTGFGDVVLAARRRLVDETNSHPSWGLQAAVKLPTASGDLGLGSGDTDVLLSTMTTGTYGGVGCNLYYELELLGDGGSDADMGHAVAFVASVPLDARWSAFAEVTGRSVPEQDVSSEFVTAGLYWAIEPSWILDAAIVTSFGGDEIGPQFTVGMTRNFGRWRRRVVRRGARPGAAGPDNFLTPARLA